MPKVLSHTCAVGRPLEEEEQVRAIMLMWLMSLAYVASKKAMAMGEKVEHILAIELITRPRPWNSTDP